MSDPNQEQKQDCNPSGTGISSASTSTRIHRAIHHRTDTNTGIYNEQVLALVFRCINWDPQTLCSTACASRRHKAVAERILFYELCLSRAPRLVPAILPTPTTILPPGVLGSASAPRLPGGWPALAKLLLYCCGCSPSRFFALSSNPVPGHFTPVTRFSKTSGKSFLVRRCRGDVLYVSDPCEHASPPAPGEEHDLGAYRGVFGGFVRSRTRACLIRRNAELDECVRCPYCGTRVWSLRAAGLVPRSASRRLGSVEDGLEYFVCVNGHLHGSCWLARLSSSSANCDSDSGSAGGNDDDDGDGDDDETVEP